MTRRKIAVARAAVALWTTCAVACLLGGTPASADATAPLDFDTFISLGRVSDPQFSPDGEHVAYVVTYQSLETNGGDSDIYLIPTGGGESHRLTIAEGRDNQPRFSPDGKWIAFTSTRSGKSQIWLLPTEGGEAKQLTALSTGASSPQWTSDGRTIVFVSRVYADCPDDDCNAARLEAEASSKVSAKVIDELLYTHWDHWRDGRRRHVFAVQLDDNGDATMGPWDLTPYEWEAPTITLGSGHDVAVSPDGREVCVVANTDVSAATSIDNDLFVMPTSGGKWTRISKNPANDNHPVYSPDGRYIAFRAMSRPGFEADRYRLALYDRKSGETIDAAPALADEFDRSVAEIAWAPDGERIYVTCSDAGYRSLYEVRVDNKRVRQLTEEAYVSNIRVSADGKRLAMLGQSATMPYEVFTADAKKPNPKQLTRVNDGRLANVEMNPLESFYFEGAEEATVHGWLLRPPGFDPDGAYPLVFLVHGGPQGAFSDSFHWRWNYQMFAAVGYVVVAINPRGSTGYGQTFTDEITLDWNGKVYEDLMKGLDHVLAEYDFIDPSRMAAAGASYGGYMMNWFEGHTTRFNCLVNHDGVYNLASFYGATEELWFPEWEFGGAPWENPELYEKMSPHTYAPDFQTPMLVVHGGLDFRVPLSQGMECFTALQRQGVPSKFLYFPDEGHWVLKPLNAQLWWQTVLQWIASYTQPGAMP